MFNLFSVRYLLSCNLKMVSYCCVSTCSNSNNPRGVTRMQLMHRFPRDPKLVSEWLRRIGNPSLKDKGIRRLYQNYRICDVHFSDECRMPGGVAGRRTNLRIGSIPTLSLPTSITGPVIISPYPPVKSGAVSDNGESNAAVCEAVLHDGENSDGSILLENVKQELCRICGNKECPLQPIFGDTFTTKNLSLPLSKVLEMHLPLQLSPDDKCPSNICSKCLNTLSEWHELYVTCAAADKAFKNAFCKEKVQNSEVLSSDFQDGEFVSSMDLSTEEGNNHSGNNFTIEEGEYCFTKSNFKIERGDHCYSRQYFEIESKNHESLVSRRNENDKKLIQSNISPAVNFIKKAQGKIIGENRKYKQLEMTKCQHLNIPSEYREYKQLEMTKCQHLIIPPEYRKYKQLEMTKCQHLNIPSEEEGSADECSEQNYVQIVFGAEESVLKKSLETANEYWEPSPGSFRCKYCQELFYERVLQKVHVQMCENTETICEICGKDLLRRNLLQHKYSLHNMDKIICEKCGQYVRKIRLTSHMQSAHSDVKYCELCCSILRSSVTYAIHKKKHRLGKLKTTFLFNSVSLDGKDLFVCSVCGQSFNDKIAIIIHLNEQKLMKCPQCLTKVNSEKKFILHKCKQWNCQFCPRKFYRHKTWKNHEGTHTEKKPYACRVCNISFETVYQKQAHLRSHHCPAHMCQYCGKKFTLKGKLTHHIKCIHEGLRFTCEVCDKKFTTPYILKNHLKKHISLVKESVPTL